MDRRNFFKYALALPAIPVVSCVSAIGPENKDGIPKALIVDPYQINMEDLIHSGLPSTIKIIRLRRPKWGMGDPIVKIF